MRPGTQRPIVYVPLNQYEYSTFVHRSRHEVIPRAEDPQLSSAGELCEMSLKIDLEAGLRPPPPPESGTPDNRFIFQRKIGQGAEGIVYAAVPSDQLRSSDGSSSGSTGEYRKSVAIKVITGRAFERCRAMRHLWPSLVHPNVVYPRSAYFDNTNSRCFLEMELLATDLLDDIERKGNLEDSRASEVTGFLAAALDHLHRRGVAHRDVKLENVFVQDEAVKLGDLGGITHVHHSSVTTVPTADQDFGDSSPASTTSVAAAEAKPPSSAAAAQKVPELLGSTIYAPPESVRGGCLGSGGGINRRDLLAGDMWSLGVTLYSAVAGCHPWEVASETSKEFRRFLKKGAAAIMLKGFSPGLKSLLTRLLALDPSQRPTAAQVLADPWVTAPPESPASPTLGVAPTAVDPPAPVTPTGPEIPLACGDAECDISPVKAAPDDASPIPASKPRGRRPIATGKRTARVVTAAEVESYADVPHTECRKRKKLDNDSIHGPLLKDDPEACCPETSALEGFIDGDSCGGKTPPSKIARVEAPSPLTLPRSTVAPTERHASLANAARSWKGAATPLQEEARPSGSPLSFSET